MNNRNFRVITVEDWHQIRELRYSEKIFCYKSIDSVDCANLGIYLDGRNQYHSSGYTGVCILKEKDGKDYIDHEGKKIVLHVKPRFRTFSPWKMLAEIMQDEEYDDYVRGDDNNIYMILDEENPIHLGIDEMGGEVLLAISFIRCCHKICSVSLKRKMSFAAENLNGRVRGRIDFSAHIKKNVARGRSDRMYCRYPVFSEDILENRILKAALVMSERILGAGRQLNANGMEGIRGKSVYCDNRLRNITYVTVSKSDFSAVSVRNFSSDYAPALRLAQLLLSHSEMSINTEGTKSGYVVPYAIRMEALFEFYARTRIKKYLKDHSLDSVVRLDSYKNFLPTIENDNMYLMKKYIPDIAFQVSSGMDVNGNETWKYVAVLDVKYQRSTLNVDPSVVRHNTHQLTSYTLLLSVKRLGFIFPDDRTEQPEARGTEFTSLILQNGNAESDERTYAIFYFCEDEDRLEERISELVEFAVRDEDILRGPEHE